jgi:hypothetical protein
MFYNIERKTYPAVAGDEDGDPPLRTEFQSHQLATG